MLPENKSLRLSILQTLINNKKKIFFALEELKILNKQDLKIIENLISIKKNQQLKTEIILNKKQHKNLMF